MNEQIVNAEDSGPVVEVGKSAPVQGVVKAFYVSEFGGWFAKVGVKDSGSDVFVDVENNITDVLQAIKEASEAGQVTELFAGHGTFPLVSFTGYKDGLMTGENGGWYPLIVMESVSAGSLPE